MSAPRDIVVGEVCIVLLTGLGDVVMGLPMANAIRRQFPGCRITWVAEPAPSAAVHRHPAVDEVVVYQQSRGVAGVRDLRRKLAGRRFDLTINCGVYFKSIWPTAFSGAPVRLGFGSDRARDLVWMSSNRRLPARPRRHTVDMFLEFAEYLGVREPEIEWRMPVTDEERALQREFFDPLRDRPVVALVPASKNHEKDWFPERWAEVVDVLEHDLGWRTMILGGPGERETRIAREISEHARAKPIWAMGDGVRRVVWQLAGSDLVIAPDTGPLHIARAMEVPVIGLYGHTNPYRVGPYRLYEDLWIDRYTEPGAAPDPSHNDPRHGRMEQITARDVLERVERARQRYGVGADRPGA